MPEGRRIAFDQLDEADLVVDATYEGGVKGNAGDDPLHRLLRCGIGGGFRSRLNATKSGYRLVVLYSDLSDNDWPDVLNSELGRFIYYGDNKHPGRELHRTKRGGNRLLASVFEDLHLGRRSRIPPFLLFTKGLRGRDVVFRGLAVPGRSRPSLDGGSRSRLAFRLGGTVPELSGRIHGPRCGGRPQNMDQGAHVGRPYGSKCPYPLEAVPALRYL